MSIFSSFISLLSIHAPVYTLIFEMDSSIPGDSHKDSIHFEVFDHPRPISSHSQQQPRQHSPIDEQSHLVRDSQVNIADERRSSVLENSDAPGASRQGTSIAQGNKSRGCIERFQYSWALEVLSSIISICALVSVFALLSHFNGKSIPIAVSHNVALATVLSILATVLKTAIFIPISAVFGQIMWIKVRRQGLSLRDVDRLYSASYGGIFSGFAMLFSKITSSVFS